MTSLAREPEDPFDVIPPNFEMCETHKLANYTRKVSPPSNRNDEVRCPCCNKATNCEKYSILEDTDNFAIHGFGISLYFSMMRYLMYICLSLAAFAIVIILIFYSPLLSVEPEERIAGEDYEKTFVNSLSIGSVRNENDFFQLLLFSSILGAILFFYFAWVQAKTALFGSEVRLRIDNLTPAGYTVALKGVPIKEMSEQEILNQFLYDMNSYPDLTKDGTEPITAEKIISAYDLKEYGELKEKISELRINKRVIEDYRKKLKDNDETLTEEQLADKYPKGYEKYNYKEICNKYTEARNRITELTHLENVERVPQVFITLTRTVASDIVDYLNVGMVNQICSHNIYTMREHSVKVESADEPEDVMWVNLGIGTCMKFFRFIGTIFVTLIILGICFIINILISQASKRYNSEDRSTAVMVTFSVLFALTTSIVNFALSYVIPYLTRLEAHSTQTNYYCSLSIKLSLALFLNSGVIPIITYEREIYFTNGGFIMTVWMNWLFLCFLTPIMDIIDIGYLISLLRWKIIKSQKSKCLLTQRQANELAGPYEMDIVTKFSQMSNIMLYTSFYITILPYGICITLVGLFFEYWITKILLINRYKVPRINGKIALYSMHFIGLICPIASLVSGEIFLARFGAEIKGINILLAIIPFVLLFGMYITTYILRYVASINIRESCCFKLFVGLENLLTKFYNRFRDVKYNPIRFMMSDYEIMNPVTRATGTKRLMDYLDKGGATEEQKQMVMAFSNNMAMGVMNMPAMIQYYMGYGYMNYGFYAVQNNPVSVFPAPQSSAMLPLVHTQSIMQTSNNVQNIMVIPATTLNQTQIPLQTSYAIQEQSIAQAPDYTEIHDNNQISDNEQAHNDNFDNEQAHNDNQELNDDQIPPAQELNSNNLEDDEQSVPFVDQAQEISAEDQ